MSPPCLILPLLDVLPLLYPFLPHTPYLHYNFFFNYFPNFFIVQDARSKICCAFWRSFIKVLGWFQATSLSHPSLPEPYMLGAKPLVTQKQHTDKVSAITTFNSDCLIHILSFTEKFSKNLTTMPLVLFLLQENLSILSYRQIERERWESNIDFPIYGGATKVGMYQMLVLSQTTNNFLFKNISK